MSRCATYIHLIPTHSLLFQSKLFNRFRYLAELYEKSRDLDAAVATLRRALQVLPLEQLVSMDTARKVAVLWVRINLAARNCKNISPPSSSPSSSTDLPPLPSSPVLVESSVLGVLDCERLTCEQRLMYARCEQDVLQTHNHNHTHSPLVAVLCDLLHLYVKLDRPVLQARVRTQLARTAQHCTSSCQHQPLPGGRGPLELLDESMQLLERLSGVDHTPLGSVWQELAEARLWRVLISTSSSLAWQQQNTAPG